MAYDGPPKLVRDKIPDIITAKGEVPITHIVSGEALVAALLEKLAEEVREVAAAENVVHRAEELADLMELIRAIANQSGYSLQDILQIMEQKAEERGGFDKGIILERTEP
jgi:predicted house-cleaning noncanonical NTP pyrophosphatase (MazG superfamily)